MTTTRSDIQIPEGYVFACALEDLPPRGKHMRHIGDKVVLIVAVDGEVYAIEDRCPQTGRSIAHGAVIDHTIKAPTTGARYDLDTGRYLGGGQTPFQSDWLTVYRVHIIDGNVYVRMALPHDEDDRL